jgi:1-acyl-sn-glycerol-3-phosphate acyltransferase
MTPLLRANLRGARLIVHLCTGLLLVLAVTLYPRLSREKLTRWWNSRLLVILHVRVRIVGQPAAGARLIVCNHISWLDIPVLASAELTRFVSKAEVGKWPIAGALANAAGTFYIRRGAGGTKQLIQAIAAHLRDGGSATVFPEGTTTEGGRLLKFQPRLFAAAIDSGSPVQPIALRYGPAANGENIAAFVGEQTLTHNLRRLLKERELDAELHYCALVQPQPGQDRAAVAQAASDAIAAIVAPGSLVAPQADTPSAESLAA